MTGRRGRHAVLGVVLLAATASACAPASPTVGQLAAEPVLQPLDGEIVLGSKRLSPRAPSVGRGGRDGAVERVVALGDELPAVADDFQRRGGDRYRYRRTDLPTEAPTTVELRGTSPTGAEVIVVVSTDRPVPLFAALADLRAVPPDRPTVVVVTVVSRQ